MQIFKTDPDYEIAARDLDDRRLNKQIIEAAELIEILQFDTVSQHYNHPLTFLYRNEQNSLEDLYYYMRCLFKEYGVRYGSNKLIQHKTFNKLWVKDVLKCKKPAANVEVYQYQGQISSGEQIYDLYKVLLINKWNTATPLRKHNEAPEWYKKGE